MGSFIALYGVANTRRLIAEALARVSLRPDFGLAAPGGDPAVNLGFKDRQGSAPVISTCSWNSGCRNWPSSRSAFARSR